MLRKFALSSLLFLYSGSVAAQILNLSAKGEWLPLDDDFLLNLADCIEDLRINSSDYNGVSTTNQYVIKKITDEQCEFKVLSKSNTGLNITQNCIFTKSEAYDYANALYRFWQKGYNLKRKNTQMLKDEDYLAAEKILKNDKICQVHRDALDFTKEFRVNLASCRAFENEENRGNSHIIRRIKGYQNEKCDLLWQIDVYEPKKIKLQYLCNLSDEQLQDYEAILQTDVIPAEDGLNFSAVERYTSDLEIKFIIQNCELKEE